MSCLQFNETGFGQKIKYIVICVECSSWIQNCKTSDQSYSDTSRPLFLFLYIFVFCPYLKNLSMSAYIQAYCSPLYNIGQCCQKQPVYPLCRSWTYGTTFVMHHGARRRLGRRFKLVKTSSYDASLWCAIYNFTFSEYYWSPYTHKCRWINCNSLKFCANELNS